MDPEFLDTPAALTAFLDGLGNCDGQPPRFYMDLEGNNLSRAGTLSLVTILLEPEGTVHLVDVTTLGQQAFTTAGRDGRTLQGILESRDIIKVFFDIRNDSDALFSLHGIRVAGIEDLQLMELASRSFAKRNINGLAKCIERDSTISLEERRTWRAVKDQGKRLFDPQQGGTYAVFDRRPLSKEVKDYCTQDVSLMPHLWDKYRGKLCDAWWQKIETETSARIRLSQSPAFVGKGQHMALGPPEWLSWHPSPAERMARSRVQSAASRKTVSATRAASSSHESIATRSEESDDLIRMMRRVALTDTGRDLDTDSNEGDLTDELGQNRGSDDCDSGDSGDLTACGKECGYCGCCEH